MSVCYLFLMYLLCITYIFIMHYLYIYHVINMHLLCIHYIFITYSLHIFPLYVCLRAPSYRSRRRVAWTEMHLTYVILFILLCKISNLNEYIHLNYYFPYI